VNWGEKQILPAQQKIPVIQENGGLFQMNTPVSNTKDTWREKG